MRWNKSLFFVGAILGCGNTPQAGPTDKGATVETRFPPPAGADRSIVATSSFGHYLRQLPLKPAGSHVHLFDGRLKSRQDVHAAVVNMSVGTKDLQQCADVIIRLRAEHLFAQGRHDAIRFNFTNGFPAEWERWRKGERIRVNGNACSWTRTATADASHDQLLNYLSTVFTYAGTLSLAKELAPAAQLPPEPGDVFIQGGSPGHAVIVVDVARAHDGRTYLMLAQSYMPAQEIHILRGPVAGAWYELGQGAELRTPEWSFNWDDRRRWP